MTDHTAAEDAVKARRIIESEAIALMSSNFGWHPCDSGTFITELAKCGFRVVKE